MGRHAHANTATVACCCRTSAAAAGLSAGVELPHAGDVALVRETHARRGDRWRSSIHKASRKSMQLGLRPGCQAGWELSNGGGSSAHTRRQHPTALRVHCEADCIPQGSVAGHECVKRQSCGGVQGGAPVVVERREGGDCEGRDGGKGGCGCAGRRAGSCECVSMCVCMP